MSSTPKMTSDTSCRTSVETCCSGQGALQLGVGHPVPDVEDVVHHEVLDVDVVGGGAGENVGQVGQPLDHDDAVVAGGREEPRDGIGDEDGDQDRRVVRRGRPRWVIVGRWGRRRGPMHLSWQDFAGFASENCHAVETETTRSSFCRKGACHHPFPGQKLFPVILGTLRTTLGRLGISEPVDTQILFLSENFRRPPCCCWRLRVW